MGWNSLKLKKEDPLIKGIDPEASSISCTLITPIPHRGRHACDDGPRHRLRRHRAQRQSVGDTVSPGKEPESRRAVARQLWTFMNIYPAVDILEWTSRPPSPGAQGGRHRLRPPVEMAQRWAEAGAEWLHVVDLDGAFEGSRENHASIAKLLRDSRTQSPGRWRDAQHAALDQVFSAVSAGQFSERAR
jgi:hypothetical protein